MELGARRPEIIDICEAVKLRTYLDEEVYLVVWLEAKAEAKITLSISYFIRGEAYRFRGENEKAVTDYEMYIKLSDNTAMVERVRQLVNQLKA